MEDATRQFLLILSEQMHHLVLRLAAMNHQRELGFYRPFYLFLESLELLVFELTAPVIIKSYLSDSDQVRKLRRTTRRIGITRFVCRIGITGHAMLLQYLPEFSQLFLPVSLYLFRMQTNHRISIAWIFLSQCQDRVCGLHIDGRQEHLAYPRFLGTGESLRPILIKLLRIEMRMCIYYFEHCPINCQL